MKKNYKSTRILKLKPARETPGTSVNPTEENEEYHVILDKDGGITGTSFVEAKYGEPMPTGKAPQKKGYVFIGYYSELNGEGTQYYDSDMNSVNFWDQKSEGRIYAYWVLVE